MSIELIVFVIVILTMWIIVTALLTYKALSRNETTGKTDTIAATIFTVVVCIAVSIGIVLMPLKYGEKIANEECCYKIQRLDREYKIKIQNSYKKGQINVLTGTCISYTLKNNEDGTKTWEPLKEPIKIEPLLNIGELYHKMEH